MSKTPIWQRISVWGFLTRYRWALKFQLASVRQAVATHRSIRSDCESLLDLAIRHSFELPLPTDDAGADADVGRAVHGFLTDQLEDLPENAKRYEDWLRNEALAVGIIEGLLRTEYWMWSHFPERNRSESVSGNMETVATRYESLAGTPISLVGWRDIRRLRKVLKSACKVAVRELKEQRKERIDVASYLENTSAVAWFAFMLPSTLSLAAYVYTSSYFGHFGIDTGLYFSITDYLAFSVHRLYVPLGWILLGGLATLSVVTQLKTTPISAQKIEVRKLRPAYWMFVSSLIALTVLLYWALPYAVYIGLIGLVLAMDPSRWFDQYVMKRYLRIPRFASWVIRSVLLAACVLWLVGKRDAQRLLDLEPQSFVLESRDRRYDDTTHRLVGSSSAHLLLIDDQRNVLAVPTGSIVTLTTDGGEHAGVVRLRRWILDQFPAEMDPDRFGQRDNDQ